MVGACQICSLRCTGSVEACPVGQDGEGKTREYGDDSRDLPSSEDCVADSRVEDLVAVTERQFVGEALLVVQSAVEVECAAS